MWSGHYMYNGILCNIDGVLLHNEGMLDLNRNRTITGVELCKIDVTILGTVAC